ncbi:hypothetical protein D3C85_675210 [compost metagenome]
MRAAAEEGRIASDGFLGLVAGDGGEGGVDGNDAVGAVRHQHAFADTVEDDEGASQGRFARMLVAQVRHQHARRGAVRVEIGLDAHHAAHAARLAFEQLRLKYLARAARKDGVEEAAEAALRLGRDELLETPPKQLVLVALQQAAGRHVDTRDDTLGRQRKVADGRLFIQLRITVAAAFIFILQLFQLGQGRALHFQLDLADLQLMQLAYHLFIRLRRHHGLALLRRQLLGLLSQPGRPATVVEWFAHDALSPAFPSAAAPD